jgi:hypothetical protein
VTERVQDSEGRFPPDLNEEVCRHYSDEELIARVRYTRNSKGWATDPFDEALDTLARRLEELEEGLEDALPVIEYVSRGRGFFGIEPYPDARARRVNASLRFLLHPEPQEVAK